MINIESLRIKSDYLKKIRSYLDNLGIIEVDTPLAYTHPVTDPHIDNFSIQTQSGIRYLQSSPEYAMKRLLSEDPSTNIYQICKAFRNDPKEKLHNHEFTLLEWYEININHKELMRKVENLIGFLSPRLSIDILYISYQNIFEEILSTNPHNINNIHEMKALMKQKKCEVHGFDFISMSDCLDIIFNHYIQPWLKKQNMVFIFDYHRNQSCLAKILTMNRKKVAARFELFYKGIEIANGYYELNNKHEQLKRFQEDLFYRKKNRKQVYPIDYHLLDCLNKLPNCSGVAIGIERLIMCLEGYDNIHEIIF